LEPLSSWLHYVRKCFKIHFVIVLENQFDAPTTQSEKLGLKDVFFGLYQYQIIKTGLQLVEKWYYLSREKPVCDFTGALKDKQSSRLC
jgi:hypothetical protein